jgi:hypothetical protein
MNECSTEDATPECRFQIELVLPPVAMHNTSMGDIWSLTIIGDCDSSSAMMVF